MASSTGEQTVRYDVSTAGGGGDGAASPPANEIDVVRQALDADYEVLEEIGRGGMAVVYRARERQLDRDVAIKVLPFALTFDAEVVERFLREARTSAQLEHPHIVPIYRVGRSGPVIYFAMKLLRGESLSTYLERHGQLPVWEVRRILAETAGALGYAAERRVVHRDVKPDNIMLDEERRCVVTDFGIARSSSEASLTATGISIGTPRYMSPEQARGRAVDGRSDLYSLGVVGYECLVGMVPFSGEDALGILMDHVQSPVPRPALASDDARRLYRVIEQMLAKRPEDRFRNTGELLAALTDVGPAAAGGPHATTVPATGVAAHSGAPSGDGYAVGNDGGPRPAAALDRALDAGVQLLREQRPRVEAGVAASLAAGRRLAEAHGPRVRSVAGRLLDRTGAIATGAVRRATAMGARFWTRAGSALVLSVAAYYGIHFAVKHRSRCPVAAVTASVDGGAGGTGGRSRARPVALLVDAVGSNRRGSDLDVYYDVCGLDAGTAFRTRVAVVRSGGSALRRLFGDGVSPVTETFDESASGPATRRHRTLDVGAMPAGAYTLFVAVTDASGRRREQNVDFQIVGR